MESATFVYKSLRIKLAHFALGGGRQQWELFYFLKIGFLRLYLDWEKILAFFAPIMFNVLIAVTLKYDIE